MEVAAVVVVAAAGVPEVVRPEPEVVPAARARPERARAAVAPVRRERDHQHQKARQAIHNAALERPARESAILVPAIPIDPTGAEPKGRQPAWRDQAGLRALSLHFLRTSFPRSMSLAWTGVHAVMFAMLLPIGVRNCNKMGLPLPRARLHESTQCGVCKMERRLKAAWTHDGSDGEIDCCRPTVR